MASPNELFEMVDRLKVLLVLYATGKGADSTEYEAIRKELLQELLVRERLPRFVRTYHTLEEFWPFIKATSPTYEGRRIYLHDQFEDVTTFLEDLAIQTPADKAATTVLTVVDSVHVQDAWNKALERRLHDPEGAITSARSLLESVCKFILDETGQTYDSGEELPKFYALAAQQINLSPSLHEEQIFKQILSGVTSVVYGLGAMRNKLSDAHGKGKAGVRPGSRHAQLAVNLAGAVAVFLIETYEAKKGETAPYSSPQSSNNRFTQ